MLVAVLSPVVAGSVVVAVVRAARVRPVKPNARAARRRTDCDCGFTLVTVTDPFASVTTWIGAVAAAVVPREMTTLPVAPAAVDEDVPEPAVRGREVASVPDDVVVAAAVLPSVTFAVAVPEVAVGVVTRTLPVVVVPEVTPAVTGVPAVRAREVVVPLTTTPFAVAFAPLTVGTTLELPTPPVTSIPFVTFKRGEVPSVGVAMTLPVAGLTAVTIPFP